MKQYQIIVLQNHNQIMMKIFIEKGDKCNIKQKIKWDECWSRQDSWDKHENEIMNHRGYVRINGKWTKIQEEFKLIMNKLELKNC